MSNFIYYNYKMNGWVMFAKMGGTICIVYSYVYILLSLIDANKKIINLKKYIEKLENE